ncbi:hypothetical protein CAEBREN_25587 [Caenorhabditis brenneri]|uniref:BTB domain-containing protein n=1 Tax=Caenorhabditis brenneri TaxID=135651 RepID=G0MV04_CAEBE|nr:hypothetical protein CAEBREN_25587 [Caenorhabditis brenneri]
MSRKTDRSNRKRKRVGWDNELAVVIPRMDEQPINFEDEDKDMHDVVLVVQGKKFFCSKIILAKHSGIMKSMFFGPYEEREKKEIELHDVSIVDFNNFLLLIHGALEVNDENLVGLLKLSNMWLAPIPLKKCRDFLMNESEKPIKDRYDLSVQYDFEDVKTSIVKNVTNTYEFRQLIPDDIKTFDPSTMALFLEKSLKLNGITPGKPEVWPLYNIDPYGCESPISQRHQRAPSPFRRDSPSPPHGRNRGRAARRREARESPSSPSDESDFRWDNLNWNIND